MRDDSIPAFLEALAAKKPTPGGGAAAALMAGIAAALAEMVINFSRGRKDLAEHEEVYHDLLQLLEVSRQSAPVLAEEDARAYQRLNALQKLDESSAERRQGWPNAVERAIAVPMRVLDLAIDLLQICEQLLGRSNRWLASDLAIAAVAAEAAAASAGWNVRVNLPLMADEAARHEASTGLDRRLEAARALRKKVEDACR